MKKLFLLSSLVIVLFASCGPSKNDVILVNDNLVSKVTKCANSEKLFFETCKTYSASLIQKQLTEFINACKTVKAETEAVEIHADLAKLKESSLKLINTYLSTENDYKEYARLYSIPTADYTSEDDKLTAATATKINNEIDMAFTEFNLTQKEFGNKYGYTIADNKKK